MNTQKTLNCMFFEEDLVYRINKNNKIDFGIVVESFDNVDSDSDDSDDTDDTDDDGNKNSKSRKSKKIQQGFCKVSWHSTGKTEAVKEKEVAIYDRALLHGDVVRRVASLNDKQKAEFGYCKDIEMTTTIKILGTNKVIENIDCMELLCLTDNIVPDSLCVFDSWIGYIRNIRLKMTLKCADGSLCVVNDEDLDNFVDLFVNPDGKISDFEKDDFYVGQLLYGPKKDLKNAKWINQTQKMKSFINSIGNDKIRVTVKEVIINNVSVVWLTCVNSNLFINNNNTTANSCETKANSGNNVPKEESNKKVPFSYHRIHGDDLKRIKCLNYFQNYSLQVGDHCYYDLKSDDKMITEDEWRGKQFDKFKHGKEEAAGKKTIRKSSSSGSNSSFVNSFSNSCKRRIEFSMSPFKKMNLRRADKRNRTPLILPIQLKPGCRYPIDILSTKTIVTVVWQSSLIEQKVDANLLYPVHHIDSHDFFPGDYVCEASSIHNYSKFGVVQKVDHDKRIASVNWFEQSNSCLSIQNDCTPKLIEQESLSVYDIKDHNEFDFRMGCCVFKLSERKGDFANVGQVIDLNFDGQLLCRWIDGSTSLVYPYEILLIVDNDDLWDDMGDEETESLFSSIEHEESSSSSSDDSWITESEKSFNLNEKEKNSEQENITKMLESFHIMKDNLDLLYEIIQQNQQNPISKRIDQEIMQLTKRLKSISNFLETHENLASYFKVGTAFEQHTEKLNKYSELIQRKIADITNEVISENDSNENNQSSISESEIKNLENEINFVCDKFETTFKENQVQAQESEKSSPINNHSDLKVSNEKLLYLESVPNCHHWKNTILRQNNLSPKFFKRISEEIKLLRSSLPDGIFVAGFEDRIDLYSIMIFGPKSTPYQDGVFIFDVELPCNYPDSPPNVYYISYCSDRINPNLYENGKVCVSLLGTWTGKGTEVWSANSNLLQLIVSIQGLILVDEPYYNEAGYTKQRGTVTGNENSCLYNEMVVIKLVQSMTKLFKNPPETFKERIINHLVSISDKFIKRHENYLAIAEFCNSNFIQTSEQLYNFKQLPQSFVPLPEFPLLPPSHGFCLSLRKALINFTQAINNSK